MEYIMLVKLNLLFFSFFYYLKYNYFHYINKSKNKKCVPSHSSDVIISLTTFKDRIDKVYLTLESLVHQKTNISFSICLFLSKEEFFDVKLPKSLNKLKDKGVEIYFVDENIKSYKKIHYSLTMFKNKNIITSDDDIYYPPGWLDNLYQCHLKNKLDIICYRARDISLKLNQVDLYSSFKLSTSFSNPYLMLPTGVSGIFYPANCFYSDVTNKSLFIKLSPTADDLWYKIMTLLNGRKCRLVGNTSVHFPPVLGTQEFSLRYINTVNGNSQSENDRQLTSLLKYYNINLSKYK